MMTKRILSILTAVMLFCSMIVLPVSAEEQTVFVDGELRPISSLKIFGDYQYYERKDGTIAITDYLGYENKTQGKHLAIPAKIEGKTVTRLGAVAFQPPSEWNKKKKKQKQKQDILIPSKFETVNIPKTVKEIGGGAFAYCEQLTNMRIPNGVVEIDYGAFEGCFALKSVYLPASLKRIDTSAFYDSPNLKTITVSAKNKYLRVRKGMLYSKNGKKLIFVPWAKKGTLVVPKGTTQIASGAFLGIPYLKKVLLPKGLKEIGDSAFLASSIQAVEIPSTVNTIGELAFSNMKLKALTLPKGIKKVEYLAFASSKQLKTVTIGENIQFAAEVFDGCPKLKTYRIGKGVKFGSSTFARKDDGRGVYKGVKFYGYKGTSAEKNAKKINKEKLVTEPKVTFVALTSLENAIVYDVTDKPYTKAVKANGAKQSVKVYVKGKKLKKGKDYTVSYKDNKKRGKATVIITGINKYDGVIKRTFRIK